MLEFFVDKIVDVSVHHRRHIGGLGSRPVVLYHGVGLENVGAYLGSPGIHRIVALEFFQRFLVFLLFQLGQLGHEYLHGHFPVLMLAPLVLARYHYVGRQMGYPYG